MHLSDSDWAYVDERAEHFTGREWVFERIRTFLASDARLLVIVAPPGTGKTAIAARLAQASAGRLPRMDRCRPGRHPRRGGLLPGRPGQPARGRPGSRRPALEALPGFARRAAAYCREQVNIQRRPTPGCWRCPGRGERRRGQRIDLARLGPERAFADGLALPLRRLSESRASGRRSCSSTRSTRPTRRPSRRVCRARWPVYVVSGSS